MSHAFPNPAVGQKIIITKTCRHHIEQAAGTIVSVSPAQIEVVSIFGKSRHYRNAGDEVGAAQRSITRARHTARPR